MGVKKVLESTQEFAFPRGGGLEVSAHQIGELETALDDKFTDKHEKKRARRSRKDPRTEQIHAGIKVDETDCRKPKNLNLVWLRIKSREIIDVSEKDIYFVKQAEGLLVYNI